MSAAHPLRTYDVVQPQTTGGGVTANTNYFVKKWTDTTFSLHSYDSNEDGTKGWTTRASINNDVRVSINSTSFPTMWWGYPHLPNSGLVKTIVKNAFNGHECIRMNFDRSVGYDAMAYGGGTPTLVSASIYTYSCWYRAGNDAAIGKDFRWSVHYYVANYGADIAVTNPLSRDWQRLTGTLTAPTGSHIALYWWPSSGTCSIDVSEIQIESGSRATPFTPTTRGATVSTGGGLYDLSENRNHGELVGGAIYSASLGGSVFLDGVDDYIQLPSITNGLARTVDITYKLENYTTGWGPLWRSDWRERIYPNVINIINEKGTYYYLYVPPNDNSLVNITYSYNGTTLKGYRNGILLDRQEMDGPMTTGSFTYRTGYQCGGAECANVKMYLYNLKFYDRALSDDEVFRNFQSIRNKFNL
jgi:hypothetical protein